MFRNFRSYLLILKVGDGGPELVGVAAPDRSSSAGPAGPALIGVKAANVFANVIRGLPGPPPSEPPDLLDPQLDRRATDPESRVAPGEGGVLSLTDGTLTMVILEEPEAALGVS